MSYERQESEAQRLDRNFNEQLQELRISQAGVQILFAFLLILPFQQRFSQLSTLQHGIYLATLGSMAICVVLFTAPVALHRRLFRTGLKDTIVAWTDRLISAGLVTLALGVIGAVVLVLDVLLSHVVAIAVGALLAALVVGLWLVLPHRLRRELGPADRGRP